MPISWATNWLEQDARLRTDFNVTTGIQTDRIRSIKEKSEMKKYYAKGGIPTARQIRAAEGFDAVRDFARLTDYPIITVSLCKFTIYMADSTLLPCLICTIK